MLQVECSAAFISQADTDSRAVLAPYQPTSIETLPDFPGRLLGAEIRQKILSHRMYVLAACVRMHEAEEAALETIVAIEQGSAALAQWLQAQLQEYSTAAGNHADEGAFTWALPPGYTLHMCHEQCDSYRAHHLTPVSPS